MEAVEVLEAATDELGGVTIPADKLSDIVRNADAGAQVTIATRADDPRVLVQSGRSRFNLPALPISDFPQFEADGLSDAWAFPAKRLADMISRVSFVRAPAEPLTALSGVHLNVRDGELHAVAAQKSGIALRREPAPEEAAISEILLPKFTGQAIKWLSEMEGDVLVSTVPGRLVRLQAAGATLTTKVYGGPYVDYKRVLLEAHDSTAKTDQDALALALRRVMVMGDAKSKSVRLRFGEGGLVLTARNAQSGDGVDEISCDYADEADPFLLSADHLQATLEKLGGDVVEIGFAPKYDSTVHATGQVIIHAPADPGMIVNLMQMRA